ncbi:hypothetical protein EJ02DRAFT_487349 [Clathrospora elynae]|uniref:Uncharacterized protein n=1 Tax=Clathrospora elynae TaxID=706981 RepID=A0A6A5STB1_9PLEO|nr:hypothetical protein EJ02DRAFT_487349 [Clathrospora elynae]
MPTPPRPLLCETHLFKCPNTSLILSTHEAKWLCGYCTSRSLKHGFPRRPPCGQEGCEGPDCSVDVKTQQWFCMGHARGMSLLPVQCTQRVQKGGLSTDFCQEHDEWRCVMAGVYDVLTLNQVAIIPSPSPSPLPPPGYSHPQPSLHDSTPNARLSKFTEGCKIECTVCLESYTALLSLDLCADEICPKCLVKQGDESSEGSRLNDDRTEHDFTLCVRPLMLTIVAAARYDRCVRAVWKQGTVKFWGTVKI